MDPIIGLDGCLDDPRIRVSGQVKSIFTDLEMKGMFAKPKGKAVGSIKGEYHQ